MHPASMRCEIAGSAGAGRVVQLRIAPTTSGRAPARHRRDNGLRVVSVFAHTTHHASTGRASSAPSRWQPVVLAMLLTTRIDFNRRSKYKDRGGLAQLGTACGTGLVSRGISTTVIWLAHWPRRAEASRPRGRLGAAQTGTVLSCMCNFRPFRLNGSRCINLVTTFGAHVLGALEVCGALAL